MQNYALFSILYLSISIALISSLINGYHLFDKNRKNLSPKQIFNIVCCIFFQIFLNLKHIISKEFLHFSLSIVFFAIILFLLFFQEKETKSKGRKATLRFPIIAFFSQFFILITVSIYRYFQIDDFYSFVSIAIYAVVILTIDFILNYKPKSKIISNI